MLNKYYHPITGMFYRKTEEGTFEYKLPKLLFLSTQKWKKSGLPIGFHNCNESLNLNKLKMYQRDLAIKAFFGG